MAGVEKLEKRLARGARVAVKQDRLLAAAARLAAENLVLAAWAKARVIGEGAVGLRHFAVVFLQPRAHLSRELALQRRERSKHAFGIGILRLEKVANVRGKGVRLAQHVEPIVRLDPGIVVRPTNSMRRGGRRQFFGQWRRD